MLLQVLEDGHMTDAKGRRVSFKNTVLIMTSNAGVQNHDIHRKLGFKTGNESDQGSNEEIKNEILSEIKHVFRPEFLNRIDDIIVFRKLNDEDMNAIVSLLIQDPVSYTHLSMECLKGGLVSIAIGALVYLLVIRTVFLRKREGNTSTYVDAWPKWLDLENLVYRPLIQRVLPFIGIFVCRIGDSLVDGLVVLLRKTLFKDRKIPYRTGSLPKVDTAIGKLLDVYKRQTLRRASCCCGRPGNTGCR